MILEAMPAICQVDFGYLKTSNDEVERRALSQTGATLSQSFEPMDLAASFRTRLVNIPTELQIRRQVNGSLPCLRDQRSAIGPVVFDTTVI